MFPEAIRRVARLRQTAAAYRRSWSIRHNVSSISLQDRGIVEIAGADATKFLHNLVTNDIANSPRAKPAFARCWRRRGEILGDFLFFTEREGESRRYLLDCPSSLEPDLLRRLGMYKLRAAVSVTSKSDKLAAFPFSARRNRKFPRWR